MKVLAALFALLFATSAQASVWRYSFDVVSSELSFYDLTPSSAGAPYLTPQEADDFATLHHPFGPERNTTGRVTWLVELGVPKRQIPNATICVSGFLCLIAWEAWGLLYDWRDGSAGFDAPNSGNRIILDIADKTLFWANDSGVSFLPFNSHEYSYRESKVTWTLDNIEAVEITDYGVIPLPAGLPLLLGGLGMFLGLRQLTRQHPRSGVAA